MSHSERWPTLPLNAWQNTYRTLHMWAQIVGKIFWPGGGAVDSPAFYSYSVPQPQGIETQPVHPTGAGWNTQLSEFILMYDDVRRAESPAETLYEFLEST